MRCVWLLVLFSAVFVLVVEARRSGGLGSRRAPSRPHKHVPIKVHTPSKPKHTIPKTSVNKFLEAERKSVLENKKTQVNNFPTQQKTSKNYPAQKKDIGLESVNKKSKVPIGFDKLKQTDTKPINKPIGVEHLKPVQNAPSAPPLPNSFPQPNVGQYPQNLGQQHIPSAPPLPGSVPNKQSLGQYPSYSNPQYAPNAPPLPGFNPQQNLGQYPPYVGQHTPSAPFLPGPVPNQQISGQYPAYPNSAPQYIPNAPPLSGSNPQQNPYYPYQKQQNPQPNIYPNVQPQYLPNSPQLPGVYHQPNTGYYPDLYPNQPFNPNQMSNQFHSANYPYVNQYPHYNQPSYPSWVPNQPSFYPGSPPNVPYYSNNGFFGTSMNGLNNYGSHYSPYPGYTGMYGNKNYGSSYKRSFIPIPIPLPIPIPTSWGSNEDDAKKMHDVFKEVLRKIEEIKKNQTSVFVLNNSTVTPCEKDEFIYSGGLLNLTVTTCTMLNCTAVSMKTTFNSSGTLLENTGLITMCLNPNATISTNHSGTAQPSVSDIESYWRLLCLNTQPFNQSSNSSFVQNVTQNDLVNITNKGQPLAQLNISNSEPNKILNISDIYSINNINSTNSEPLYILDKKAEISADEQNSTTLNNILQNITTKGLQTDNLLENSTVTNTLNSTYSQNNATNGSQICEILDCYSTEFCMPTVEIPCSMLNVTCKQNLTSYKSCIRLKMCKSPSTPLDRFVTLNTTISHYDTVTNNLTEQYELNNLTVVTYFPPVLPSVINCSSVNGTNSTCFANTYNGTSPLSSNETLAANRTLSSVQVILPIDSSKIPQDNDLNSTQYANSTESSTTAMPIITKLLHYLI